VFRIGGNTFYDQKNKNPKKIPESKRSEIGVIAECRGTPNGFPNLAPNASILTPYLTSLRGAFPGGAFSSVRSQQHNSCFFVKKSIHRCAASPLNNILLHFLPLPQLHLWPACHPRGSMDEAIVAHPKKSDHPEECVSSAHIFVDGLIQ
jgi:hypothetical protein